MNLNLKISNKGIITTLMIIILMEGVLGGGGRLFDFGLLSIRMYLFLIAVFFGIYALISKGNVDRNFACLIVVYSGALVYFSIIGLLNGARTSFILKDIKPLLGFYYLLFFYFTIRTKEDVLVAVKTIKVGSLLLALIYLTILIAINTNIIPFMKFYKWVEPTEEFFFRGNFAFFYKGFIYLGVGVFFYAFDKSKIILWIIIAALLLTFTRGFLLSIVLVYLFHLIFIRKKMGKLLVLIAIIVCAGSAVWKMVSQSNVLNRDKSDADRITQINEVIDDITLLSAVSGHGFGVGVPSRPERMEITYLEIFHKQGIIGLLFWFGLLFYSWSLFVIRKNDLSIPFMLSIIFIYVQSTSNPFLMNPIGLIMITLSLVSLNILKKEDTSISTDKVKESPVSHS